MQNFTLLDGWQSYDPTEALKAPPKNTSKKSAKQGCSSESIPTKSAQQKGPLATPPAPAMTDPTTGPTMPTAGPATRPTTVPSGSATGPTTTPMPASVLSPISMHADWTESPSPHPRNLPLPNGQVSLIFFWHSLSLRDQQVVSNICQNDKSQRATFTIGSAGPTLHGREQASSSTALSEPKGKGKGKEKENIKGSTPLKSPNTIRFTPSGMARYKPTTVEDAPEESDGGISYVSDPPLHDPGSHSLAHGMATRPRWMPPPFQVSSDSVSTHMSVKVGQMLNILQAYSHGVHPTWSKQSSAQCVHRETRPSTRSHAPTRRTHGDSDADDEDTDEDEDKDKDKDAEDNEDDEDNECRGLIKADDKELSDYQANKYPPFSEEHFHICSICQWIQCAWNFGVREFTAFTGLLAGPPLPHRFFTQKYKDYASPMMPVKEAKLEKHKEDSAVNWHKKTTLDTRQRTANRHSLICHVALLDKLDLCHMSMLKLVL
ncbi:hypothetical protein V8D89_006628 [Ganoderma adspersum]